MKKFDAKLRKFAAAIERINTEKLFLQAARETSELALDLNRSQLIGLGIDSEGKSLGKYKESTKKRKAKKGQETEHITLYDEGNFQGKMILNAKQIPIFIESKDQKAGILKQKWPNALGLIPKNQEEYGQHVKLLYKQKVNQQIEILKEKILQ